MISSRYMINSFAITFLIFCSLQVLGQANEYETEPVKTEYKELKMINYDHFYAAVTYAQRHNRIGSKLSLVKDHYYDRRHEFKELIENGEIIGDGELYNAVNAVFNKVLQSNPSIGDDRRMVIIRNEAPGSYTSGDHFVFIHLGLIARCESEDQLAWIFSNELAHDSRKHHYERLMDLYLKRYSDEVKSLHGTINRGRFRKTTGVPPYLVELFLPNGDRSRMLEMGADSLAYEYFSNTGYKPEKVVTVFDTWEGLQYEPHRTLPDVEKQLHLSELKLDLSGVLPLKQPEFVEESEEDAAKYHFHVDGKIRKAKFMDRFEIPNDGIESSYGEEFADVRYMAECELVAHHMRQEELDKALFVAMNLLSRDESDLFAKRAIAFSMIYLGRAKEKRGKASMLSVRKYDPPKYRSFVQFLKGLKPGDCMKIGEHFVKVNSDDFSNPMLNPYRAIEALIAKNYLTYDERLMVEMAKEKDTFYADILYKVRKREESDFPKRFKYRR